MKDIAVLLASFQTTEITAEEISYYNSLSEQYERVIIILDNLGGNFTNVSPLDYNNRQRMVMTTFTSAIVLGIRNYKSNIVLSNKIDELIENTLDTTLNDVNYDKVVVFAPDLRYNGKFTKKKSKLPKIKISLPIPIVNNEGFREGVVYATTSRFPVAYPTVDVAILNKFHVLLARKPNEDLFRFIGGFVDPTDLCLENAAKRESKEEAGDDVVLDNFKYRLSQKVEDFRYKNTTDGIMTSLFTCDYVQGMPIPSDDLKGGDLEWFTLKHIDPNMLVEEHRLLFLSLRKTLVNEFGLFKKIKYYFS